MHRKLHVIHRNIGGVGEITHRLQEKLDERIELSKFKFIDFLKIIKYRTIEFHQPLSHLFAVIIFPIALLMQKQIFIILHEASNYDESISKTSKKRIRCLIIFICEKLGYKILSVSKYIIDSYNCKANTINYTHLFFDDLLKIQPKKFVEKSGAIIWMRPGDAERAFSDINIITKNHQLGRITVLGDEFEFLKLKNQLKNSSQNNTKISIEFLNKIPQKYLLEKLSSIKWFINPYPREGFGLTAFQAMYFGAIVIAPKTGAISEWLSSSNLNAINDFHQGRAWGNSALSNLSEVNIYTAKNILAESDKSKC